MGITIEIKAGTCAYDTDVSVSGSIRRNITSDDRDAFGLSDNNIQKAVQHYNINYNAYLCGPTPGGLYNKYDCEPVRTVLKPVSCKVVRVSAKPVLVSRKNFVNDRYRRDGEFSGDVVTSTQKTVTHSWKNEEELSVGGDVKYDIKFPISANIKYKHSWGRNGTETQTDVVTSHCGVRTCVGPRGSATADFRTTRYNVVIKVEYEASLTGHVIYHKPGFLSLTDDDSFYRQIGIVMDRARLDKTITVTETIKIDHFDETTVRLSDGGCKCGRCRF